MMPTRIRLRVILGRFLVRMGRFVQSLALMVMRSEDLTAYSRLSYAKPDSIANWSARELVGSDLNPGEKAFLDCLPVKSGRLLLLGLGGGREAIFLAKSGFQVTGIDFIPEMVESALQNADRFGVKIEALVQNISNLKVPSGTFDAIWLSTAMYSCIPTRRKRVEMLKRIGAALRTGGYFVCQFHWDPVFEFSSKIERVKKIFAYLTWGNLGYEKGDMLWANMEFIHAFSSEDELRSEFENGGFETLCFNFSEDELRGGAILKLRT